VGLTLIFLSYKLHSTVLKGFCAQENTWQGSEQESIITLTQCEHVLSATELYLLFSWLFHLLIEENKKIHFKQE